MEENKTVVDATTSSRGAQWAGAGSLIALAAQSLFGNGGGLGGIIGGGAPNGGAALATENALLKAKLDTLEQVGAAKQTLTDAYYGLEKRVTMNEANIAATQNILSQITKVVVPSTVVCTASTTTATTSAT